MKRHYITLLTLLATACWLGTNAQQVITYNQYGSNPTPLNPTASLLRPDGEVVLLGRRQWVGLEGAPEAYWLSGHLPWRSFSSTVGLNVRHETLAVEQSSEVAAYLAKAVRISSSDYLAVSLSGGFSTYRGDFAHLDPSDPAFHEDIRENTALLGFGMMLYRPEVFYVGLSMPRLALNDLGAGGDVNRQYNFRTQYHAMSAVVVPLDESFDLKPAVLVSYVSGLPLTANVSATVYVEKAFGLGLNVRGNGDLAGMLELKVASFKIGYSYQFNSGSNPLKRQLDDASHEVGLSYRFGKISKGIL